MPRPGEDLVHQIPSLPGCKKRQMPGVCPGYARGGCLSFDLTDTLRMECSTFGNRTPQRDVLGSGAPSFDIPKSVLEYNLQEGLKIKDIASMLSKSESTVYRRIMRSYGLSAHDVTIVTTS